SGRTGRTAAHAPGRSGPPAHRGPRSVPAARSVSAWPASTTMITVGSSHEWAALPTTPRPPRDQLALQPPRRTVHTRHSPLRPGRRHRAHHQARTQPGPQPHSRLLVTMTAPTNHPPPTRSSSRPKTPRSLSRAPSNRAAGYPAVLHPAITRSSPEVRVVGYRRAASHGDRRWWL